MTGADSLRDMRRAGKAPRCIWIVDGDNVRAVDWHKETNLFDGQFHAEISIAQTDIPEVIDLRFVVGLTVHLSAERGDMRARRLHAALIDAGARRVITSIHSDAGIDLLDHDKVITNG